MDTLARQMIDPEDAGACVDEFRFRHFQHTVYAGHQNGSLQHNEDHDARESKLSLPLPRSTNWIGVV